jgi:PAS domain S-box-containing protein
MPTSPPLNPIGDLTSILDQTPDAIAKIDRDWRIVYLNRPARKLLAASGDVIGTNHWESFPSSRYEGSPWLVHYYRAMDHGIRGEFEHYYPAPLHKWLRVTACSLPDGIVVFFRDTTAAHRADAALREQTQHLQLALNASNGVGTWSWDFRTGTVLADKDFATFYGLQDASTTHGTPVAEFTRNVHPEDLDSVETAMRDAQHHGSDINREHRILLPNGTTRWVDVRGRCQFSPEGTPIACNGVTIDITERRLAEQARLQVDQALRNSEERLRIAAETAQLGTWELDIATGQMACSVICQQNFGRPNASFRHSSEIEAIVHPDDRALFQQAISRGGVHVEYRVYWPDGSIHWILSSGTVQYSATGEPARIIGVTMNVTDRHAIAETMMQTEKLAAVGRLASSIAHEINNPLESVTNLLYLAQHTSEHRSLREYLTLAERELTRVSLISNQTLKFHKQSTRPRPITSEDLFDSVMSLHHGRVINRHVSVEQRRRTDRPILCFDGEIRQVLNNLVGNAIDAMGGNGGRLLLRSREATDWPTGRRGMVLTIGDTGGGISSAAQARIFDAFFTTKGIGGTGLGLWVSKEIVDRHAGRLRFRSSQRHGASGTVFSLFLPYDAAVR